MSVRLFIFEPDGTVSALPQRVANNPTTMCLPQYAGQRLRVAYIFLDTQNRRPVRVRDMHACYLTFDTNGYVYSGLMLAGVQASEIAVLPDKQPSENVVSVEKKLLRDRWERDYLWLPEAADIEIMRKLIWPEPKTPKRRTPRRSPKLQIIPSPKYRR